MQGMDRDDHDDPTPAPPAPHAVRLLHALVRSGTLLADLFDDLLDGLEHPDPWPGEEPAEVILDMLAGSFAVGLRKASEHDVLALTDLIEDGIDAVLRDLKLAVELSARRHGGWPTAA